MRRRPLARFVLCFFALTLPLTWLWMEWGRDPYARFLIGLAEQLFEIGRSGGAARGSAAGARFVSVVPFVVLMAVTPGLSWRRRLLGKGDEGVMHKVFAAVPLPGVEAQGRRVLAVEATQSRRFHRPHPSWPFPGKMPRRRGFLARRLTPGRRRRSGSASG